MAIVNGKTDHIVCDRDNLLFEQDGSKIGTFLCPRILVKGNNFPISLINPTNQPLVIHENTTLGYVESATVVESVSSPPTSSVLPDIDTLDLNSSNLAYVYNDSYIHVPWISGHRLDNWWKSTLVGCQCLKFVNWTSVLVELCPLIPLFASPINCFRAHYSVGLKLILTCKHLMDGHYNSRQDNVCSVYHKWKIRALAWPVDQTLLQRKSNHRLRIDDNSCN